MNFENSICKGYGVIKRELTKKLKQSAAQFPVVTVTGPRQSGKTTLVRNTFKNYDYVSLELPDARSFAIEDPRGFLERFRGPVILDEVQRTPHLFSYIQVMVDEDDRPGRFILTGSHNFLLLQSISQSLAGRCAVLNLLPLSISEILERKPINIETFGKTIPQKIRTPPRSLEEYLFTGFYPRIYAKNLPPRDWFNSYYQTYLERDVRNVLNVGDIESFNRFVKLCAGRNGQILNFTGLASDCGVTHTTARRWLSVLEASFLIVLLRPYYKNFGKRLIKSPKLYFLDTGLLCFLLGIKKPEELLSHSARGTIFESFVLSELYKNFIHNGEQPPLYFWRDSTGHEIDILIDLGTSLIPVEVKSAKTIANDFFDGLFYWKKTSGQHKARSVLIYGGEDAFKRSGVAVYPWFIL